MSMPLTSLLALTLVAQRPLPWKTPYELLPAPTDPAPYAARLGDKPSAVYLDGDVLTFVRRAASGPVNVSGGLQHALARVGESDVYVLRAKMADWDKALVSYVFLDSGTPTGRLKLEQWRGANGPALPVEAEKLQGAVHNLKVRSERLGEERDITVYLPPNPGKRPIPVLYMADGQGAEGWAKALEPMILARKVRPFAIVGLHSSAYRGDRSKPYDTKLDFRGLEYVPGEDADRFERHMDWVTRELPPFLARQYNISTRREDRAVSGFSNGGAFAAAIAIKRPDFFGYSVPLSLGVPTPDPKPAGRLPRFFFAAGTLESFSRGTRMMYDTVKGWGADATLDLYVAGHDSEMWRIAFLKFAPSIFPPR